MPDNGRSGISSADVLDKSREQFFQQQMSSYGRDELIVKLPDEFATLGIIDLTKMEEGEVCTFPLSPYEARNLLSKTFFADLPSRMALLKWFQEQTCSSCSKKLFSVVVPYQNDPENVVILDFDFDQVRMSPEKVPTPPMITAAIGSRGPTAVH